MLTAERVTGLDSGTKWLRNEQRDDTEANGALSRYTNQQLLSSTTSIKFEPQTGKNHGAKLRNIGFFSQTAAFVVSGK